MAAMELIDEIKAILNEKKVEAEDRVRYYTVNGLHSDEERADYSFSLGKLELIYELLRGVYKED